MNLNPKWVPMKWPCGPVEIARHNQFNKGDSELQKTAVGWTRPSSLELLKGTPVNCLVVDWAIGAEEDHSQQLALKPLILAGKQLGISFVGKVSVKENLAAIIEGGRAAGLDAIVIEGSASQASNLPVISEFSSTRIEWDAATAIFIAMGNVWPGTTINATDENMDGDTAIAGPTGNPWVDSNGWLSLLARKIASEKVLWLEIDPPDSSDILPAEEYCLAVADSWAYGSRWIISLDNRMRTALLRRDRQAVDAWARICETLSFFESHAEWESYDPMGVLAVVSDFRGQNAFGSGEVLNLLNRRQIQFLIIDRERALPTPNEWLKGILWLDDVAPDPKQHDQLLAFVQQGGVLIASKYWGPPGIAPYNEDWLFGYSVYDVPKGRIVVAEGGLPNPYQLARDAHLLVSRKNDFVRLYNPGTTKYFSSIDLERHSQVIQILNYASEAASYITLWVNAKIREARLWRATSKTPVPLSVAAADDGTGFDLPAISVNCAIEIERLA